MSALAVRHLRVAGEVPRQPRLFALPGGAVADAAATPAVGGGPGTLDLRLRATIDTIVHGWSSECPVCSGTMRAHQGAAASCTDCGTIAG